MKGSKVETVSMEVVRAGYRKLSVGCWFDKSIMRFYRSIMPRRAFVGPGGVYFVSSEQFVASDGQSYQRRYTVRVWRGACVETVGDFNQLTREGAVSLAKRCAAGADGR